MSKLSSTIHLMERIDKLIKRQATGTPNELADRLEISKSSLHRMLDVMKEFGAPIEYSVIDQSYVYTECVDFYCGFYTTILQDRDLQRINGGFGFLKKLTNVNIECGLNVKK